MVRSSIAATLLIASAATQHSPPRQPERVSSETPTWSPDGREIAFSAGPWMRHQIYVIDVRTGRARRLTGGEQNRWPSWSPDGGLIVFMSDRDGQAELYTMAPDGSQQRRLTTSKAHEFAPAWSPKGDRIAYISEMPGAKQQFGIFHVDGGQTTRLDGDHLYYGRPSWLPDGSKALIAAHRDRTTRATDRWTVRTRIYAFSPDGGDPIALTTDGYDTNPSPSPDGFSMVFDTGDGTSWSSNDGQWDLWLSDLRGVQKRRLTSGAPNEWGAAYSPDGKQIAFSSGSERVYELHVMNADGNSRRTLTTTDRLPDATAEPGWKRPLASRGIARQDVRSPGPRQDAPPGSRLFREGTRPVGPPP